MRTSGYLSALLLSLGIISCSQEIPQAEEMSISLQASFEPMTKAVFRPGDVGSATDMRSGKFGAAGYTPTRRLFGDNNKGISHEWKSAYNAWAPYNAMLKWPDRTTPMSFYAYFPLVDCSVDIATNESGDVLTLHDWIDGYDILYARSLDRTFEYQTDLHFQHAFSKIESVNLRIPEDSKLTFYIGAVELTATHSETDARMILRREGDLEYVSGAVQMPRSVTLDESEIINKERIQQAASGNGYVSVVKGSDNAFLFPVETQAIWDGTNPDNRDGIALEKTCLHLKAKVKQNAETVLQGVYVIGSESQYGDIYIPLRGASNPSQQFLAGHRYTINVLLRQGVGYNKDGKQYQPLDLMVDVEDWKEQIISVGQITAKPSAVTLTSSGGYLSSVVINASHTDLSQLSVISSDPGILASLFLEQDKIYVRISRNGSFQGSGTIEVNDQVSNSMAIIDVNVE